MATCKRQPKQTPRARSVWSDALLRRLATALRVSLALAAIAILTAGAVQLIASWREPPREVSPEPAADPSYPPAMGEVRVPEPVRPADPGSFTVFGLMAQEAERADNLRAFIARAQQRPEAGGVSYAAAALTYCDQWEVFREELARLQSEVAGSYSGVGPKSPERLQAITWALGRCDGLSPAQTSLQSMFTLYDSKAAKLDQILAARGRLQQAKHIEERQIAVRDILLMRDPLLLASVGRYLGQGLAGAVPQVDGINWGGVSESAYASAWSLVPCSFGLSCDETDAEVALACVQHSQCFSSRKELLKARLLPQDYADMLRLHERLIDIVARADAEALRPRAVQ
jgi:hypothetical protein